MMFGEIPGVAGQEGGDIVGEQVDFSTDHLGFAGVQAAEAEVGVKAAGDALEQFLVRFPGGGEEPAFIGAEGADETVAWVEGAEGSWVDVLLGHPDGAPDLAGGVAGLSGPGSDVGEPGELAFQEDETLGQVIVEIGVGGRVTGEGTEADAGLGPVGVGRSGGGIMGDQTEIHFVVGGGDGVFDGDAIGEGIAEAQGFPVLTEAEVFDTMRDDGVLDPIGIGGTGSAVGFEVVDADFAAGEVGCAKDEPVRRLIVEGEGWGG